MQNQKLSIDRADFVGRYLSEIGLGIGSVSLRLVNLGGPGATSIVTVVISGQFLLGVNGKNYLGVAPAPELAIVLSSLLNESISDVGVDEMSQVRIAFGPDRFLEIHPDTNGFESATINIPGKDIFVI